MAEYIESVAAYIRVSTQEQKMHGYSVAAQRQLLEQYADSNSLRITGWYVDEGVSGQKPIMKRKELRRMAEDAQKRLFSRIIFIKLDRFFRSVPEYHAMMRMIEPVKWTATEEKYDMTTPQGRMMVNMKLTIAEYEAQQTGERIRLVNEYKANAGIPSMSDHSLPIGFRIEKTENGKKVVHDQHEIFADIVQYALRSGSIRATMEYANTVHGTSISYRQMSIFLRSPLLCGRYRNNEHYCDGYITAREYEQLQQMTKTQPRNASRTYIFSGLIRCPECGRPLSGAVHCKTVKGKRYEYLGYRCPNHRINKTCGFASILFDSKIETMMLERIEPVLAGKIAESIEIRQRGKKAKNRIDELNRELERLNYAWQKGRIQMADYDSRYDDLQKKIAAERTAAEESNVVDYSSVSAILSSGWRQMYTQLTAENKRSFWKSFIQSIEVVWKPGVDGEKRISDIKFF